MALGRQAVTENLFDNIISQEEKRTKLLNNIPQHEIFAITISTNRHVMVQRTNIRFVKAVVELGYQSGERYIIILGTIIYFDVRPQTRSMEVL